MLPFMKEQHTLWDYLKTTETSIVLYGTGDGADKIMARLKAAGCAVAGVFASDEFARGQYFHGFPVRKYSELSAWKENVIVLIAFASERQSVLERFGELARIHETYAPHVPVFSGDGSVTPEWVKRNESELQKVYDGLADEMSRNVFAAVLNYRLSGKLSYLQSCTTDRKEDIRALFDFGEDETYADLGAYNGDTVREFLEMTKYRYNKIFAAEPDLKNFKKLTEFVRENNIGRIYCLQTGVWKESGLLELTGSGGRQSTFWFGQQPGKKQQTVPADICGGEAVRVGSVATAGKAGVLCGDCSAPMSRRKKIKTNMVNVASVDHILGSERADYMKFDVEGVEKEALEGARQHLLPDRNGKLPKLLVAAYHHDEDIFRLPLLLWNLQPEYKIYLRKHPYVPDWEINIFAK